MASPKVPKTQSYTQPAYQPINYTQMAADMLPVLSQYADVNIGKQAKAQSTLTGGAVDLTKQYAPQLAQLRSDVNSAYMPQNVAAYTGAINQADPYFQAARNQLGAQVTNDLSNGYNLGSDLEREVTQDLRKAQTARGNWLGPAATANEAFGKASAKLALYNQRQQNANAFLNGRSTSDMFSAYQPLEGYQNVNVITPTGNYVDASLPFSAAAQEAQNRNTYNAQGLQAYAANQAARQQTYDNKWAQYVYSQGGYGATGGGGNPWGGMLGGAASGAVSGAAIGTAITPGWGTAIGAVGGAILGGVGGYASES